MLSWVNIQIATFVRERETEEREREKEREREREREEKFNNLRFSFV